MKRSIEQYPSLELRVRIPWDSNTAIGFAASLVLLGLLALLVWFIPTPSQKPSTLPYEVLATITFGDGDGTGRSKGNLSPEGLAYRSHRTAQQLADAANASRRRARTSKKIRAVQDGGKFVSISQREVQRPSRRDTADAREKSSGTAERSIGDRDGSPEGSGRGTKGSGAGSGLGFGDIEWGGGGSAIVVRKVIPSAPENLSRSTIVKLRFTVSPGGDVIDIRPLVRGIPEAEAAAIRALRQWRFRPLASDTPVVGIITFRFDVN
ncbi:MAG: energy transducer TonB [Chlorobi bacterium]|nr:energy transducer TonB [Chlorobiota bacterium]